MTTNALSEVNTLANQIHVTVAFLDDRGIVK